MQNVQKVAHVSCLPISLGRTSSWLRGTTTPLGQNSLWTRFQFSSSIPCRRDALNNSMLLRVLCECVVRNQGHEQSEEIPVLDCRVWIMMLFDITLPLTFADALRSVTCWSRETLKARRGGGCCEEFAV